MKRRHALTTGLATLSAGCAGVTSISAGSVGVGAPLDREALVAQVTAAEIAFAKTMADRDHEAFLGFVADDAVFLNGGRPLRGKAAIGEHWKRFYSGAEPPFAWKPDLVEVIGSGALAQSIGPVSTPDGRVVARFYSTWRREADGRWRVVLDNGYDTCETSKHGS